MAGFQFAMTTFSLCTKFANGTCLVNVPHMTRITVVSTLMVISFTFIALASFNAPDKDDDNPPIFWFAVAILASCLIGIAGGMGEATFLGFLKGYPSHTVGYVSSGTGFAGISGTSTLLILQPFLPNQYIFIIACPTIFIYYFSFVWVNKKKKQLPYIEPKIIKRASLIDNHNQERITEVHDQLVQAESTEPGNSRAGTEDLLTNNDELKMSGILLTQEEESQANVVMNWKNAVSILPRVFRLIFNLCSVYFLEYCIISCFADRINYRVVNRHPAKEGEFFHNFIWSEYYVILNFSYQIGVFCSRSSL